MVKFKEKKIFITAMMPAVVLAASPEINESYDCCRTFGLNLSQSVDPFPLVNWINTTLLTGTFQPTLPLLSNRESYFNAIDSLEAYSLSIEPFALSSHYRLNNSRFNLQTYGTQLKGTMAFFDHWAWGVDLGYWHSHLQWGNQASDLNANSFYLGPFLAYLYERAYIALSLIGIGNFYKLQRELLYDQKTHNSHTAWDINTQLMGAIDFEIQKFLGIQFFIQPYADLSYLADFQKGYEEEAQTLLITPVKPKTTQFFRSELGVQLRKEFYKEGKGFLIPSLSVGWIWMQPLSQDQYSLSCDSFKAKQYEAANQLYLAAQLIGIHKRGILLSLNGEAYFANLYPIYIGKLKLEWNW